MKLQNISLVQIDCINPELAVKSLNYSCKQIEFGRVILFSDAKPVNLTDNIEFIKIDKLNHDGFSKFSIENLNEYINTDYVLSINTDGFVINPHLWDDIFFEFDYIGAPWPPNANWCNRNRVGNC